MNCSDWEERIALYLGQDLPADSMAEVERHLGECSGCQVFASGLGQSLAALQEAHREELDPAHFTAVRTRVLTELRPRRKWRFGWAWALAGTAAAVSIFLAVQPGPAPRPPEVALSRPPGPPISETKPIPRVRPVRRVRHVRSRGSAPVQALAEPDKPLIVKLLTNDPDVIIYWIADKRGD